jgi:P27 family predicted phage terminase small subunit
MGSRGMAKKTRTETTRFREGVPPPPDWLSPEALKEYRRAAREITASENALQFIDLSALATYAQAYADFAKLTVEIRAEGEIITLPNGIKTENPRFKTKSRVFQILMGAINSLGFSPLARARLPRSAMARRDQANPFLAYVK